jgi:predicted kinase
MDLERIGAPELGARFLDFYAEFSAGPRTTSLEHHYIAYRALVRAKVAGLRFRQGVSSQAEVARALTDIAAAHLRAGEPRLIIVGGLPGTGKSTLAGKLADELNAVVLRSDRIRKEDQHLTPETPAAAGWLTGIYLPQITAETYGTMLHRSQELLSLGETVILDASWQDDHWRRAARAMAAARSSLVTEIHCDVPTAVAAERVRRRASAGDPSDADAAVAQRMEKSFAAWPEAKVVQMLGNLETSVADARMAIDAR